MGGIYAKKKPKKQTNGCKNPNLAVAYVSDIQGGRAKLTTNTTFSRTKDLTSLNTQPS